MTILLKNWGFLITFPKTGRAAISKSASFRGIKKTGWLTDYKIRFLVTT
jgi:hypothetical protein